MPTQLEPQTTAHSARYVWIIAAVAAISGFLFGFDTAVINGALVFLQRQFALTSFLTEIAASALLLGCLIGAAAAGFTGDRFGRRKSLMFAALLFAASALGSALATTFLIFTVARLIGGLAIGLASALTPVYISEIAPQKTRGQLVSLNQLAIVIGILVADLTNWQLAGIGDASWRWMFGVAGVPAVGFLLGLVFIPESPRWLIAHNRHDEGYAVLLTVAGPAEAPAEREAIERAEAEESTAPSQLLTPTMRPRLLGANVAVGLVNLVCTIVAMLFIDRWGRRGLFLVASGGMTVSLTVLALALHFTAISPLVIFSSVLLYVAFFAVGLGPGVWVYVAEIFPTHLRSRASSLATTALWASCLLVTLTFLSITEALTVSGAFLLYAALSLITFFFVWKCVPETRGKSLEEINNIWGR